MGELTKRKKTAVAQASEEFAVVQSMGGCMHVRWSVYPSELKMQHPIGPDALMALKERFTTWRSGRPRGTRIPPDLWAAAVGMGCDKIGLFVHGCRRDTMLVTLNGPSLQTFKPCPSCAAHSWRWRCLSVGSLLLVLLSQHLHSG